MATDTVVHSALWEQVKNVSWLLFRLFLLSVMEYQVLPGTPCHIKYFQEHLDISSIARNTLTYHTNGDHTNEYKIGSVCVTYRTEDEYVLDFS
jgi:hypothetical protein